MTPEQTHQLGATLATALAFVHEALAQPKQPEETQEAYKAGYRQGNLDGLGKAKLPAVEAPVSNYLPEVLEHLSAFKLTPEGQDCHSISLTWAKGAVVLAFIRKKDYITPKLYISRGATKAEMCECFCAVLGLPLLPYGADRK